MTDNKYFSANPEWVKETPDVQRMHQKKLLLHTPNGNVWFRMCVSREAPDGTRNPGYVVISLLDIASEN